MESKKFAIIVAGGSGSRMQSETPKQFLMLGNKTILECTIAKFLQSDAELQVVVVIPEAYEEKWNSLSIAMDNRVSIVFGGKSRYESVTNGLKSISGSNNDLVAIHDGVRPLLSTALINQCYIEAKSQGNAIPSTEVVETLREIDNGNSNWVDRSKYRTIQTPQTFRYEILQNAYNQPFSETFTDDASVVEAMGERINLVEGERNNIKITTPEDLHLARILFKG